MFHMIETAGSYTGGCLRYGWPQSVAIDDLLKTFEYNRC